MKRSSNVKHQYSSESDSCEYDDEPFSKSKLSEYKNSKNESFDYDTLQQLQNNSTSSRRKPKCFTRNALLARENRMKKKMYIAGLENKVTALSKENKKLSGIVENQSFLISEIRKEVKYLKSTLANSSDIADLVRNIHQNTGMSVSSSLDKSLSLNNCVSKRQVPVARKTAHPWEEPDESPSQFLGCISDSIYPSPPYDGLNIDDLLGDSSLTPFDLFNEDSQSQFEKNIIPLEHNYTATQESQESSCENDDVGVCLHVSKHRVSVEFCSTCSENATLGRRND